MKKICLLLVLVLFTGFTSTVTNAQSMQTKISINGKLVEFDQQTGYPFVDENNRTLVPFRATLEAFGAAVSWNQDTRTAKSEKSDIRVEVPIGHPYIIVGGMKVDNDTSGVTKDGKTYVPIRKIMEAYDCRVEWDVLTNTVVITKYDDNLEFVLKMQDTVLEDVKPIKVIDGIRYIPFKPLINELSLKVSEEIKGEYIKAIGKYSEIELRVNDRNTIDYTLNVPPMIINRQFYVSEDFLSAPELSSIANAELRLNEKDNNIFSLVTVEKPKFEDYDELYKAISNKISYIYDIRLFTLYAFMNHTGYDDENNKDGFSEVREMVRHDLSEMNLQLLDNNYYRSKNVEYHYYRQALLQMGNAPDFNYIGNKNGIKSPIRDLNVHLKEFYNKANIEKLYEKYRPYYDEDLSKYKDDGVIETLAYTLKYLGLNVDEVPKFYIQVNLLDSYERGSGMGSIDELLGKGITTGPSHDTNTLNIVHEFLHGIINPILDDIGYENKDEDIIRALAGFFVFEGDEALNYVNGESSKKYKMTRYFFDKFSKEYEGYDGTLDEFIRDIIK